MVSSDKDTEKRIQEEVEREFPGDRMMQELHFYRRLRWEKVKHLPFPEAARRLLFGLETDEPEVKVASR